MTKKLTAGVLNGADHKETFQFDWNGESFEVDIRPLTNNQASEVESFMQEGVVVKGRPGIGGKMQRSMDLDTKQNTVGRTKSNIKAVAYGTLDSSLTEKVVENELPPQVVKDIAKRIKELSGLENEKDVAEFNEGKKNPSDKDGE